jgi:glycosyltransferase involved in cell wall biosynthesis
MARPLLEYLKENIMIVRQKDHFRFHLLGLVHLPVSERYMACAFTQKIVKMSKMLLALGHEVYLYGAEGSDAPCTEFIQTHSLKDIRDAWGDGDNRFEIGYDWKSTMFRHDFNGEKKAVTMKYYSNAIKEINKRKLEDDFILLMQGYYQMPIIDGVNLFLTVEPGIGYRGAVEKTQNGMNVYHGFESTYIQNYIYGIWDANNFNGRNGAYYDRIIPNYFDGKDFEFCEKKEDYYFFIGRMILRKGIETAVQACLANGKKLIIAGQKDENEKPNYDYPNCEYVGYLEPKERTEYMKKASGVFVPTYYLEPFGGTNVEAMLCGTPVITTNFGAFTDTVLQGVTGYRCDTLDDFIKATLDVKRLDPKIIRKHAEQYLMENMQWKLEKWFRDLYQVYLSSKDPKAGGWAYIEKKNMV